MRAALGLGSSLGPRRRTLELVLRRLDASAGIEVLRVSRWVITPPLRGGRARNPFLNGVALLETRLEPEALLDRCVALEDDLGRRRGLHWADRPVDLDVLLYGPQVITTRRLSVPHPHITSRRFVLEPLLEVWPHAADPRTGRPYAETPLPSGPRPAPVGLVADLRKPSYQ